MIFLFILTLVFLALWIKEKDGKEDYHTTVGRIDRMLSSIDDKVTRLSGSADAGEPELKDEGLNGTFTRESIVAALQYHHFTVEEHPVPDDPENVHFYFQDEWYRIKADKLPYLSIETGYCIDPEGDNVNVIKQVASEITYNMFIIKVMVSPEENYYLYQVDFIADSYLSFRDSLLKYLDVLLSAKREFRKKYDQTLEDQKQASKDALQTALLAAQTDAAGNKILS